VAASLSSPCAFLGFSEGAYPQDSIATWRHDLNEDGFVVISLGTALLTGEAGEEWLPCWIRLVPWSPQREGFGAASDALAGFERPLCWLDLLVGFVASQWELHSSPAEPVRSACLSGFSASLLG
jgi:hypothetical protein